MGGGRCKEEHAPDVRLDAEEGTRRRHGGRGGRMRACRKVTLLHHESAEAVLQELLVEVDQQPHATMTELQVVYAWGNSIPLYTTVSAF